ncbi:pilus assembly protein [Roseomonas alkaliterrae]|uniref:Flp pilus assembly protein TadG n=1 Tax=Neoroseomonas alkaliterrae TaxID=1452450 RepID=A0A840Y2Q7_9PROT|nr:TadE/TadG family type IV pilus assembly protein [Neoroseomonas alkaliterrae]MBB5690657.1 Flp pilus assembly protein TadG [Neoroseomonas alkaliterrae]MBR0676314.1 pilus assembly protein [Neoroseomonas alkaliterrae]
MRAFFRNRRSPLGRRGALASEFAIIAIPFFITVIATIEAAWQLATGMALDHAALRASRYGVTGSNSPPALVIQGQQSVPTCRSQNIAWMITRSTGGMLTPSNLTVETRTWSGVSGAEQGTGSPGAGAAGQIVSYRLTYRQPFVTGIVAANLWGGTEFTHTAFLIVKNEPFENATC